MSNINNNTPLDTILQELKAAISELPAKKQGIIADWLSTWTKYLRYERTFIPDMLRRYKRGDIVHLNLGFNVGNEQGGAHYAVVVDVNQNGLKERERVHLLPFIFIQNHNFICILNFVQFDTIISVKNRV